MYRFFSDYLVWHYGQALVSYVRNFRNIWWFVTRFFSMHALLSSLFLPYKRIHEERQRIWDIEAWFGAILINILSRIIGFFVRITLFTFGLAILIIYSMIGFIGYFAWLGLPIVVLVAYLYGLILII